MATAFHGSGGALMLLRASIRSGHTRPILASDWFAAADSGKIERFEILRPCTLFRDPIDVPSTRRATPVYVVPEMERRRTDPGDRPGR